MKLLISKQDNTKALLLAFVEDDVKTLQLLHDNSLIFGMYTVWFRMDDRPIEKLHADLQPIVTKFPSVQAIAFLSVTKGFVPATPKEMK